MSNDYNIRYILLVSFISAIGGYLFGFDFAVISGALPFLKIQFGLNAYSAPMPRSQPKPVVSTLNEVPVPTPPMPAADMVTVCVVGNQAAPPFT